MGGFKLPSLEKLGKSIGQEVFSPIGKALGGKKGESIARNIGGEVGGVAGVAAPALLAFKHGGKVPGSKGKPVKAIVHSGEYILPVGVKPTMAQKKAVAAKKKASKKN